MKEKTIRIIITVITAIAEILISSFPKGKTKQKEAKKK